jgi:hypothetical protein
MHNATQGIGTTLVYLVLCEAQEWLSVVHLRVLHALRSVYSVVSLLCVTGARLAQLAHLCVLRDSFSWGHSRVLQAQAWLCCFIHLCVLQVWLSWVH